MSIRQLDTKVTTALRGPFSREFKIMAGLAGIVLAANVAYIIYAVGFTNGVTSTGDTFTVTGNSAFGILLRAGITMGLVLCFAGLAIRRLSGLITSSLGVILLVLVYSCWRLKSLAFLRNTEVPNYDAFHPTLPHVAGLLGATWWDLLMLMIAAILFISQGILLIRIIKHSESDASDSY